MARKAVADMTLAQKDAHYNNQFRKELYDQALENSEAAPVNDDIAKFRADSYKQALKDAKANS